MISPGSKSVKAGVALSGMELDVEVSTRLELVDQHGDDVVAGDPGGLRVERCQDAVTQHGVCHGAYIGGSRVISSLENGAGLGGKNELNASSWASTPGNHFFDEIRSSLLFGPGGSSDLGRVGNNVVSSRHSSDDVLEF